MVVPRLTAMLESGFGYAETLLKSSLGTPRVRLAADRQIAPCENEMVSVYECGMMTVW